MASAINNPIVDMMVTNLPLNVLRSHGGSESLADKINALIYESVDITPDQDTETPKKRGRPAGSKNKKDVAPATEVTETPKKRGRPTGSKNKSNTPDAPTKRPRKPDQHTRKSKKSMTAATVIQRAWRTSH